MKREIYAVVITLIIAMCVVAVALGLLGGAKAQTAASEREQLAQTVAKLENRILQAEAQRSAAEQRVVGLQDEVIMLSGKRAEERQVIQDLWTMLATEPRHKTKRNGEDKKAVQPAKDGKELVDHALRKDTSYDVNRVKELVASLDGNLDAAMRQIVTAEGIRETLKEHAEQPVYWSAAASLAPDKEATLEYLKEAAKQHPDSPAILSALVSEQIAAGQIDESTLAYAMELERLDPTNALGDCYAAQCQFQRGDTLGALQSLAQAAAKGRFSDDRIAMLMARRDYLLDEGLSGPAALGLSAFTLPLEHLGMIRQLGNQSIEQARSLSAAGRLDDALKVAQDVSNIGRTVSSSGRFLIHDRVGIALQQAGLTEQRQIYEAMGDAARTLEIDAKLQAIQERSAMIDTMAQGFGSVMANMTEEGLAAYVDGTILNGEFATLQSIPEIARALQQVQRPTR